MAFSPIIDDLSSLRIEFRRLGFYRPASFLVSLQWAYNLILALGGMLGWYLFEAWWLAGIAILISTLGMSGVGTLAHTAAHGAAFAGRRPNAFFAYFGFPFMLMISLSYWRCKHNGQHHPSPNVVGADEDCDLMPFFAMSEDDVLSAGKIGRFYYRTLARVDIPARGILKCYQHAAGFLGKCFREFREKAVRQTYRLA